MSDAGIIVLVAIVAIVVIVVVSRANELFCLSVKDGRVLVVRGRIPPGLLHALTDVVARARVPRGTIRAYADTHHARLAISGMDDGIAQRLRNTFGHHPTARIKSAPPIRTPRNLGQLLGIAWLAWLFTDRR